MNPITGTLSSTTRLTHTNIGDKTNAVSGHDTTLIIILTVTIPTLVFIIIVATIIILYRRRYSTIWLKKLENSSRLQAVVVNLSPTMLRTRYAEKKFGLSHLQFQQPHTTTIVYNHMSAPTTPVVYTQFKLPSKGENNAAFDECLLKNEQQPILRSPSSIEQPVITLQTEYPASLQAPVPSITSTFVEAIASHRLTLISNTNTTPLDTSISTRASSHSRDSGTSYSNSSQTNAKDRQRVTGVIAGIVNGVNLPDTNITTAHCSKSVRMLLSCFPIGTLGLDEAMLRVVGTADTTANITFGTNNELVDRIYGVSEIRTEILNSLNRP